MINGCIVIIALLFRCYDSLDEKWWWSFIQIIIWLYQHDCVYFRTILSIFAAIVAIATFFDVFYASKTYGIPEKPNFNSSKSEKEKQVSITNGYANGYAGKLHQDDKMQQGAINNGNINGDKGNDTNKDENISEIRKYK